MAFIPNIPSSLGAISEFDKAITELLRHGAGELSSRIQLLIEDMLTRWLALDERIAIATLVAYSQTNRLDFTSAGLSAAKGERTKSRGGSDNERPCPEGQNLLRHAVSRRERGLNENTNGLIRDFFPKGTDFSTIANAEVAKVERLLNARPRKSLGFRSPQEVFDSLAHS